MDVHEKNQILNVLTRQTNMKTLLTKGSLQKIDNKDRKNGEKKVYYTFWFSADLLMSCVHGFPYAAFYFFTKNEFERYFEHPKNVVNLSLLPLGELKLFMLGRKQAVLVRVTWDGEDKVIRIPMRIIRYALERSIKNPEDVKKPKKQGFIKRVISKIGRVLHI